MYLPVENVAHAKLLSNNVQRQRTAETIKQRVKTARQLQAVRYGSQQKLNSDMTNRDIKQYANLSDEAKAVLDQAALTLDISARSYMRAIKIARTIADLDGSVSLEAPHITEALQYRAQIYQLQLEAA